MTFCSRLKLKSLRTYFSFKTVALKLFHLTEKKRVLKSSFITTTTKIKGEKSTATKFKGVLDLKARLKV